MVACEQCGKTYTTNQSLHRHQETTCGKPDKRTKAYKQSINLQNISDSHVKVDASTKTTNNIQNINQVIQHNQIVLNDFGEEEIDYIAEKVLNKLAKDTNNGLCKLIQLIHFSPDHPENKNVTIPNIKQPYAKIVKDGNFMYKAKKDVLSQLRSTNINALKDRLDYIEPQYIDKKRSFEKLVEYYENAESNDDLIKILENEIFMLLLNNRLTTQDRRNSQS